jgi:hypothetical protein
MFGFVSGNNPNTTPGLRLGCCGQKKALLSIAFKNAGERTRTSKG